MDNPKHTVIFGSMTYDVLIVGGGLNGPALALALAQGGVSVAICDALPPEDRADDNFDGRSYALAIASQRLLKALGVWEAVSQQTQPILKILATDGRVGSGPSPLALGFDHAEIEEGPMGYMIEDRFLRRALMSAMDTAGIDHRAGTKAVAQTVTPAGVSVTLADGEKLSARLLVGADGRRSGVAARAGLKRMGWDYGQTALVSAIEHDLPHNGVAHQFFMPSGPLAILPLTGNRSSIVWSEKTKQAQAITGLDDNGYLNALRPRFGDFLGDLRLVGKRFSYPLSLSMTYEMVAPRIALVGDAAHGVHPVAGQGLNLGFRDIGALAEILITSKRLGEDFGAIDVLKRYQEWRRFDTVALAAGMDGFVRIFSNDNQIVRTVRDLGMAAVNALPGLRRGFMREAAGLNGKVPKLLRGLAI